MKRFVILAVVSAVVVGAVTAAYPWGFFKVLLVNPYAAELNQAFETFEEVEGKSRNTMSFEDIKEGVESVRRGNAAFEKMHARRLACIESPAFQSIQAKQCLDSGCQETKKSEAKMLLSNCQLMSMVRR